MLENSAFRTQDATNNKSALKLDFAQLLSKLVSPLEVTEERIETARFAEDQCKSWVKESKFDSSIVLAELPAIEQRGDQVNTLNIPKAQKGRLPHGDKENIENHCEHVRMLKTGAPKPKTESKPKQTILKDVTNL